MTLAWKRALAAIIVVELALFALYFDTAQAMVGIWIRSETFNHAFLVPIVSIWLIWEKRYKLAREVPKPNYWLALPFIGLAFVWFLGDVAAANIITFMTFTGMVVLSIPMLIGVKAAKTIAFPLGFLFFSVPFGEFLMPKLMDWTAYFTVMGLRASGIPVYQEGLHFVIPSGRWSVVQACSGVRYLIASIVVGTLYAYLNYQSLKRRLIFVGVSILVPLVANWVRAYFIVMLGHLSSNKLAVGVDHLIYGWIFFGIVIMIIFAIGMRWREYETAIHASSADSGFGRLEARPETGLTLSVVLALCIASAPHIALLAFDYRVQQQSLTLTSAPLETNGWKIVDEPFVDWMPAFVNPSSTMNAVLAKKERKVGVFVYLYRQQNYERKLISSSNALVNGSEISWLQVGSALRKSSMAGQEQEIAVRTSLLSGAKSSIGAEPMRLRVWHWYWIDGRMTADDYLGKLLLVLSRLKGGSSDSAAVFVYTQEPDGEAVLADYLRSAGSGITGVIESAAKRRLIE